MSLKLPLRLVQQVKVYTGEKKTKWFAVIGSRALQVSGYGDNPYGTSEAIRHEEKVVMAQLDAADSARMKETVMETRMEDTEADRGGSEEQRASCRQKLM